MSEFQSRGAGTAPAGEKRGLEPVREVLRGNLGRSLRGMSEDDRLAAAWTVSCGRALAGRGILAGYEDAVVRVDVHEAVWLSQMISMRGILARQMAEASGLRVDAIEFALKRREGR